MAHNENSPDCFLRRQFFAHSIGCDQARKHYATSTLKHSEPHSFMGGTIRLDYALNSGGFLSAVAQLSPTARFCVFVGFNLCLMTAVTVFLCFNWNARLAVFVSLTYILAGGIGNVIDRISNDGLVIDFLSMGVGPVRTGIFNVADVGVTFGAGILIICLYKNDEIHSEPRADSAA